MERFNFQAIEKNGRKSLQKQISIEKKVKNFIA